MVQNQLSFLRRVYPHLYEPMRTKPLRSLSRSTMAGSRMPECLTAQTPIAQKKKAAHRAAVSLLDSTDAANGASAIRAFSLRDGLAILGSALLGIFHGFLRLAFHAICFDFCHYVAFLHRRNCNPASETSPRAFSLKHPTFDSPSSGISEENAVTYCHNWAKKKIANDKFLRYFSKNLAKQRSSRCGFALFFFTSPSAFPTQTPCFQKAFPHRCFR